MRTRKFLSLLVIPIILVITAAAPLPRSISLSAFAVGGAVAVWLLARRLGDDRVLTVIVTASCLVRMALAGALYLISERSLPILRGLQLGGGFWVLSPDSVYYHDYAHGAAVALRVGLGLPMVAGSPDFAFLIAVVYRWFGPHPLYPILLSVWAFSLGVIAAYVIARDLWGRRSARVAAILIAAWPSMIVWSALLLKDALAILLLFAFLLGIERFRQPGMRRGLWLAEVAVSMFLIYRLRFYIGVALGIAAMTVAAFRAFAYLYHGARRSALQQVGLIAVLAVAVWIAGSFNPEWLGRPRDPQGHHRRLASVLLVENDEAGALWQLRAAVLEGSPEITRSEEIEARARDDLREVSEQVVRAGRAHTKTAPDGSGAPLRRGELGWTRSYVKPAFEPPDVESFVGYWSTWFLPRQLDALRRAFLGYQAPSNVDEDVRFTTFGSVVRYVPRALLNATLTPNPWTRFRGEGASGKMRDLSTAEVVLTLVLLGVALHAAWVTAPAQPGFVGAMLVYSLAVALELGLLVPTVGLLFRLRLGFLIPLCVLAAGSPLWARLARRQE